MEFSASHFISNTYQAADWGTISKGMPRPAYPQHAADSRNMAGIARLQLGSRGLSEPFKMPMTVHEGFQGHLNADISAMELRRGVHNYLPEPQPQLFTVEAVLRRRNSLRLATYPSLLSYYPFYQCPHVLSATSKCTPVFLARSCILLWFASAMVFKSLRPTL